MALALPYWWKCLTDPNNPFLAWQLVIALVLLTLHLAVVYWVYRDALWRYNRGAPWAALAAVFPFGGWLFYLLYRVSPLTEFDRLESETFEDEEHKWTDYDQYRANRTGRLFTEIASLWRGGEGSGYSPWIRLSRARELSQALSPEEQAARRERQKQTRLAAKAERLQRRKEAIERRRQRKESLKQKQTVVGLHGQEYKMSLSRQNKVLKRLELIDKLRELPREDQHLEDLIYDMDYRAAFQAAEDGLAVSQELNDKQGIATYTSYLERLSKLLGEPEESGNSGAQS